MIRNIKDIRLVAMGVQLPAVPEGHPNRTPFRGILTRVDEPSDKPPAGAGGHRVMIPAALAEAKLHTLIGMGVGVTPDLADHDSRFKIGVITEAEVQDKDLVVAGYLYAKDFEAEVEDVRAQSREGTIGMSFEISDVSVINPNDEVWTLHDLTFTGAAILKKASAAYETTSLIAARGERSQRETKMATTKRARRRAADALEELTKVHAELKALEASAEGDLDDDDVDAGVRDRSEEEMRKKKIPGGFKKDAGNYAAGDEDDDEVGSDPRKQSASAELVAAALEALKLAAGVSSFEDVDEVFAAFDKMKAARAKALQAKKAKLTAEAMKAMGMDYGGGMGMDQSMGGMGQMMAMVKAMYDAMCQGGGGGGGMMPPGGGGGMPEPGGGKPAGPGGGMPEGPGGDPGMDEGQDMAMLKRLVQKMETSYAGADLTEQISALEAKVGLITDNQSSMKNLLTDSQNKGKKLATDDASRRAEDGKPVRKTLQAGGDYTAFLAKYDLDASADYNLPELDKVLKEAQVEPEQRIAIKHALEAQGRLN